MRVVGLNGKLALERIAHIDHVGCRVVVVYECRANACSQLPNSPGCAAGRTPAGSQSYEPKDVCKRLLIAGPNALSRLLSRCP
jgi:hypothetical protein